MDKLPKFREMPREKLKFSTPLEVEIHKIVSALRYGDEMVIELKDHPELYIYAAKKSAYYNCIDNLKVILSKDRTNIRLYVEL